MGVHHPRWIFASLAAEGDPRIPLLLIPEKRSVECCDCDIRLYVCIFLLLLRVVVETATAASLSNLWSRATRRKDALGYPKIGACGMTQNQACSTNPTRVETNYARLFFFGQKICYNES